MPLVYIVILNYKNVEDTIECVNSIEKIDYDNYKLVIVDNKSLDGSYELLKKMYHNHIVIEADDNKGYAAGNNYGIKVALENNADYICVLNNDVVVEREFLKKIIFYAEKHNIEVIGSAICDYRDRNLIQSTGALINLMLGRVKWINFNKNIEDVKAEIIECDFLVGACIMMKANVIKKIGLIPEIYFLCFEEVEWCLKAKRIGAKIACIPSSRIYHKWSASINKVSGLSKFYMSRNNILCVRRNGSLLNVATASIFFVLRYVVCLVRRKNDYAALMPFLKGLIMEKN